MAWQRKIPFGYMVRNGEAVICPAEAGAVRDIFTHYAAGVSYAKIAEEMSKKNIPYHQHTSQWNKHMVKRILENGKYLGTDIYPRLINDEDFLTVQLQRENKTDYNHCPINLTPIREKAVCASCGSKIVRDTRSCRRPRWVCSNADCGAIVHVSDDVIQQEVSERLRQLAATPDLLTLPCIPKPVPSTDAMRIENEIDLCFNRADINSDYMKMLIFAAAAERYAALPDPTPAHDMSVIRMRLENGPVSETDLQELLRRTVTSVRIGGQASVELDLINGKMIGKEQSV